MQVRVNRGTFTASNKKVIQSVGPQGNQKRGSFDLDFRVDVKSESGRSSSSATLVLATTFTTVRRSSSVVIPKATYKWYINGRFSLWAFRVPQRHAFVQSGAF